jgi:hypothetical protein
MTYAGFTAKEKQILHRVGAPTNLTRSDMFHAFGGNFPFFKKMILEQKNIRTGVPGLSVSLFGDKKCDIVRNILVFPQKKVYFDIIEFCEQGKGYAGKVFRQMLNFYDKYGIKKIELDASLTHGPYVWARYGFDATPQQKDKVYNAMRQIFLIWTKGTGNLPVARPKTMNEHAKGLQFGDSVKWLLRGIEKIME